ncbi:Xaa-Pro peptidase family protein (plasmid) [Sinorhizobium medicae]|uniref:M24 family metallopeptidase n=1 Tax=Sinorhizobium medicae TaxID=110321 RepID=UPI001AAFDB3C|nr:Xaa-Pro peptidase family protein [Sinorhizobium medicae]MBO1965575.1 aminopeptidase P family protein [Sinorhizobium medicae]
MDMQFDSDEFRVRVGRLIEELKNRDLDAVILDDGEATSYYFGIDPHQSFYRAGAITSSGEAFFVLRALDKDVCREQTWVTDMVGHPDWEDPLEHIVRKLREYGVANGRIGVDYGSHALTIRAFNVLRKALPEASLVDIDGLPWLLRLRKSDAEVEKMRKASAIADATFRDLSANICPGMTERDLVRMTVESYVRHGGDATYAGTMVIRREDELDILHGHLNDGVIEAGDVLHVEVIPRFQGYGARLMRPMVLGDAPDSLRSIASNLLELQDSQFAAMKPGVKACDVDRILREGVLSAGLRNEYPNITGYTMGYYPDFTVRPSDFNRVLLPTSEWTFEEGMVFHMYTSAKGIGFSETVLITASGCERLTNIERQILKIA